MRQTGGEQIQNIKNDSFYCIGASIVIFCTTNQEKKSFESQLDLLT